MTSGRPTTYGVGALGRLATAIEQDGAMRILLVTGRSSFERSGAAAALEPLSEFATVSRWSDFDPNPRVEDLRNGLQAMQDFRPDALVGVGGGSVMDMAKLLAALERTPSGDVGGAIESGHRQDSRYVRLYLAPTTSGSGSEATHFAVAYVGATKYSVAGNALRADRVGLDPHLAIAGSPHQRATSGLDAICQAIESSWAVGADSMSRRLARHALGLLVPSIEAFVLAPDDRTARAMQIGSHLAGRAIDISKTTAAHALSYAITKQHGVDHGSAVALTLGHFIEDHARADVVLQPGVDRTIHEAATSVILQALGAQDGTEGRSRFAELLSSVGLPTSLTAVGVESEAELFALAASVNVERLGNNPAVYDVDGLVGLLRRSLTTPAEH